MIFTLIFVFLEHPYLNMYLGDVKTKSSINSGVDSNSSAWQRPCTVH